MQKQTQEVMDEVVIQSEVIILEQKPVIIFDELESIGLTIRKRIEDLNIENLHPTEDNLTLIKNTRTVLNKESDGFEAKRKGIKQAVLDPYNQFEEEYKKFVLNPYKEVDSLLKEKITDFETLQEKEIEDKVFNYFFEKVSNHNLEFLKFSELGINITKSASFKSYTDTIDTYVSRVLTDLEVIDGHAHKDRLLAKYKLSKDLNASLIQLQRELDLENAPKVEVRQYVHKEATKDESIVDNEILEMSFTVKGTRVQLKAVKEFLINLGIEFK